MQKRLPFQLSLLVITAAFFFATSCHSQANVVETEEKRDTSITTANAYSNLFFDSLDLANYIARSGWHDSLKKAIHNFYNIRNEQYAWLTGEDISEQAFAFENKLNEYIAYSNDSAAFDPFIKKVLDSASEQDKPLLLDDSTRFAFEIRMSAAFLRYARRVYQGNISLHQKDLNWFIPRKRVNVVALLDSFTKTPNGLSTEPVNPQYQQLKKYLLRYHALRENGGFPDIPAPAKAYRVGDTASGITALKKRLSATGDYTANDSNIIFTTELLTAVKQFQERNGLKQDGAVDGQTLRLLDEPVEKRIEQILVNMERMRWVPAQPQGNFILVNIPQYCLTVYEAGKPSFAMNIVVGTTQNKTVIFTGNLKNVVFSPYWNVPPGILNKEVLPAIRRNPSYLRTHHMERANGGVRQTPGPWNALGKVKFLFPNQYNIYLHDTPSKKFFEEEKRSFSHGCIRVSQPQKLAEWILRNNKTWLQQRIQNAMNGSRETFVNVSETIPVYIAYFTAWVDAEGRLNFRDDVYGHDKKLAAQLFSGR